MKKALITGITCQDGSYLAEFLLERAKKEYERWLANVTADADVVAELKTLDDTKIEDAFYRDLAFGTGGLRGVIGAGTNRMNIYTVAKASQGLADYLKKNFAEPSVAIGYDSRIKSDVFAKVAAGVFTANGVKVNIWPVLMPVPTVSFATRYLHTSAGVMITASHNPSKYNGYKVYGADGCQITTEAAAEILTEIEKLDIFADVRTSGFEAGVANGSIRYIPDEVYTAFVEQVKSQSVLFGKEVNKDVAIVYSPLNGTGLKPVTRTLKEMGYTNITVVKEQEQPDGNFPTCPYPNPEIKEAMALGMEYAKKCNADLLLATDPDCDRVGIAVKNKAGEYELLTGNQTGMLLLDYICSQRVKHGKMPADPVMVKTIVTMDMGEQIATHYGLRTINVLTGFKFIGEQIGKLQFKKDNLLHIACYLNCKYGPGTVEVEIKDSYRNMLEKIKPHFHLVETARKAIPKAGLTPEEIPVRGGTDGAVLSWKGLPCPNLGTGGFNFHGVCECTTVERMDKATEILQNIVELYSK